MSARPFPFRRRIEMRLRDCDLFGHVNHAVYFTYFEQARFALWRAHFSSDRPAFIIARAECNYRSQARFGDPLEVGVRVGSLGRSSFTFEYRIWSEGERLVAEGVTVQVIFDYEAQRSAPLGDDLRAKLSRFLENE
jgi:acyl-CoA thioester hydrolase